MNNTFIFGVIAAGIVAFIFLRNRDEEISIIPLSTIPPRRTLTLENVTNDESLKPGKGLAKKPLPPFTPFRIVPTTVPPFGGATTQPVGPDDIGG